MLYQIDRRIDSYGSCLNNKDEVAEDSNSFYETMGKYKFVLVLESSVCHEFIGRRLWQALHVGAVPVYFGADGVDAWMPNHPSVVHVSAYRDLKLLADHLKMLHRYRDQYQSLLKHKPTYNDNYFALITNNHLLSANLNAKYAELFECLVCERIGKKRKDHQARVQRLPVPPAGRQTFVSWTKIDRLESRTQGPERNRPVSPEVDPVEIRIGRDPEDGQLPPEHQLVGARVGCRSDGTRGPETDGPIFELIILSRPVLGLQSLKYTLPSLSRNT